MDYTNRPHVNKQPDESNFIFLAQLYGTVPGSPPFIPEPTVDVEAQVQVEPESETSAPAKEKKRKDGDRMLRSQVPSHRMLRWMDELDEEIELGLSAIRAHSEWKLLHRSEYGEAHEKKLDDRFKVQVHYLLA